MDPRQRQRHEARLYRRIPLIGGWLRYRSAVALGRDGAPESIQALAAAVVRGEDARVFALAMDALNAITESKQVDVVCAVWAGSRHPALARLQVEHRWVASAPPRVRVLSGLNAGSFEAIAGAGSDVVSPLIDACADSDPVIAARARESLAGLKDSEAIDLLCARWAEGRDELLGGAIVRAGYVARQPDAVRVLSALKAGRPDALADSGRGIVEPLLTACEDADPVIVEGARLALERLTNREAIEEVCRIVIETGHATARQAALAAGYLPRDSYRRALLLFFTGQWPHYEDLDFDGRLIRAGYEAADAEVQRRIRETLRTAGRADFLTVVGGGNFRTRAAVMTPDETDFLIEMLVGHENWSNLWNLAFDLPYTRVIRIVQVLAASSWRPAAGDERATFEELAALAVRIAPSDDEEIARSLPPAARCAEVRVSGEVNNVAFSPRGAQIALGLRRRRIVVWDFQRAQRAALHGGFRHSIGRVNYSKDGALICAERSTKPSETCSIFVWKTGDEERRLVGSHRGAVTAIEPFGDERLLSAGRDGNVVLWDLGQAARLREARLANDERGTGAWARAARISPDGRYAALVYDGLSLVRLPEVEFTSSVNWRGKTRCAAFAPDERSLIVGHFNGEVQVCQRNDAALEFRTRSFCRHPGQVQGIEVLADRAVVITAGSRGDVRFTSWTNWATIGLVTVPGERLTSLHVSPDGAFMAVGDSDASMSLWDLRVLDVPLLLARPLAGALPVHLAAVRTLAADQDLPSRTRDALRLVECLLRHRFRYDIEIDDVPGIRFGDHEIEVN